MCYYNSFREYEIQILDREFDQPILVIQEGDRVWWHWEQDKVSQTIMFVILDR